MVSSSHNKLKRHLILNMTWVENRGLRTFCGRWIYDRRRALTKTKFKEVAADAAKFSTLCFFCLNGSKPYFDSNLNERRKLH